MRLEQLPRKETHIKKKKKKKKKKKGKRVK